MASIFRQDGVLQVEGASCPDIASAHGTPLYVYSRAAIEHAWQSYEDALAARSHLICYAVKANSNLAVLDVLARLGSGFDIVSVGELERVLAAGGDPGRTVFSGVGKQRREMERALEVGIRCFNIESVAELERLADVASAHGVVAPVSLRINPDVDAQTHPYISTGLKENKFGIVMQDALGAYQRAAELPSLQVHGIDCHIGSQLTDVAPYRDAIDRLLSLVDTLDGQGIGLQHIDVGGGQGIRYQDETPIDLKAWADTLFEQIGERELQIMVEPGRSIVGNAGIMLCSVEYLKHGEDRNFCIVDAAMNDLIRPALYSAWQGIEPVVEQSGEPRPYDVVGPVCESADFLGKDRALAVKEGDLLAVMSAGAYGYVMSSNYNTRPRAAEVMVDGDQVSVVREREPLAALFSSEHVLDSG
ncbi:MAG: diaminopimelate decarboxylase [Gammaproteobacteria bacterium]|nr:diaminopimelate decarboxylase [Gammaproteobacteria bacterium]